ncbi:MAG: single-stranded DNA-binding protein [Spirochaetia bacterium]|nr:single-stranded DNA-binding protein [Spirochaetia bacterium]
MGIKRDINTVVLVGRLTKDVELRYTRNGAAIGKISLAVNSLRKNQGAWEEETSFFTAKLFGKNAEGLAPYLQKGTQVALKGELRQERWQYEGKNFSKVVINTDTVELLQAPKQKGTSQPQQQRNQPSRTMRNQERSYTEEDLLSEGPEFFDDDIPF